MTAPVTVTQADREAAADYLTSLGQAGSARLCRESKGWRFTAEAFARHRQQAEAASAAQVAELVEALREIERRCADFERINLGGKSPAAKAIGTIRNCAAIARAKATPDA